MVFRILPHEFKAKARSEGPSGNRALRREIDPKDADTQIPPSFGTLPLEDSLNNAGSMATQGGDRE